jgi:hypothetical protein
VIQTKRKSDEQVLELIPHHTLLGDLPKLLVENFTHWLDLSNHEIELRPLENCWESSHEHWQIKRANDGFWTMCKESHALVDIRSPTFHMISTRLKALEYEEYLVITYLPDDCSLSVDLPRFRLSFHMNDVKHGKHLESQNLPGLEIDPDQSTGTMFGLVSQLVLRAKDRVSRLLPRSRHVIIPHGEFRLMTLNNHLSVVIDTKMQTSVKLHEYGIDEDLGCLVGNVSLISRLYKIYLHAITSHCLIDPLTGRTGTEEALSELCSASCQSFQTLGTTETAILKQIGTLAPSRSSYSDHPDHPLMQKVEWQSALTPLAQHHGFYTAAQAITAFGESLRLFDGKLDVQADNQTSSSLHLIERAGRRTALFYSKECAGPLLSSAADQEYSARDLEDGEEVVHVSNVSSMVYDWPTRLDTSEQLLETLTCWEIFSTSDTGLDLSYSNDWLQRDLKNTWIPLYNLLRGCSKGKNCYQLMFSLSALAYGSSQSRSLIPTLLAFATITQFCAVPPPSWPSYDLESGFEPQRESLLKMVRDSATLFKDSPEATLVPISRLSRADLEQHRLQRFEARLDSEAVEVVDILLKQWPCDKPNLPPNTYSGSFDISKLMSDMMKRFQTWSQNKELYDYIEHVQDILDGARGSAQRQIKIPMCKVAPPMGGYLVTSSVVAFERLLERAAPQVAQLPQPRILGIPEMSSIKHIRRAETDELGSILLDFKLKENTFHQLYGEDLERSRQRLNDQMIHAHPDHILLPQQQLDYHRDECRRYFEAVFKIIYRSLSPSNDAEEVMFTAGLWPRITKRSLLAKLALTSRHVLDANQWRDVLISFAQGMLWFQRSQRLIRFAHHNNHEEFFKELENTGDKYKHAGQYPDWFLIQVCCYDRY